ncbi:MAG TPA: dihydrolipoamide acetyltransferase family protein [Actinomycetes bacterium]|nr:dihydrolipoamide acetyltransferase family protein [Actinomycetes bacterium]
MSDQQFRLPDVGEGLTEGEVLRWLVKVGDVVEVNQPLVEVETAKAAVELPSPFGGTVSELHASEGDVLPVGAPLVTIATDGEGEGGSGPAATPSAESAPAESTNGHTAESESTGPLLVGYGVVAASTRRRRRTPAAGPHGTDKPEAGPPGEPVKPVRHGGLEIGRAAEARFGVEGETDKPRVVRAKPPVRRLAKQLGVDLASVRPTGKDGTVSREDVEAAAALQLSHTTTSTRPAQLMGDRREPVRGVTRTMAAAMTESAATIPSVTEWVDVDVSRSAALVERLRTLPEFANVSVTPLLLVSTACLAAMRRQPKLNGVFDAQESEIVYRAKVNLGIAVASERGLVVPHVADAGSLTLPELATALSDVVSKGRDGSASPAELLGATFTITNVGVFGVDGGTPMIAPGQSAILAFGAWRERPWAERGQLVVRTVSTISLSFDHRFIDGATGSHFLRDVADILEEPALLHLYT